MNIYEEKSANFYRNDTDKYYVNYNNFYEYEGIRHNLSDFKQVSLIGTPYYKAEK